MQFIKKLLLKILSKKMITYLYLIYKYYRGSKSITKTLLFAIKATLKFYAPSAKIPREEQIQKLFHKVNIKINENEDFVYSIDEYKTLISEKVEINNTTIDYSKILNSSIKEMKMKNNELVDSNYKKQQEITINAIEEFINREIECIKNSKRSDKEKLISYFENMKIKPISSFEEALQRILFYNQLLWQVNHNLVGLGRLDKILAPIYEKEKASGTINEEITKEKIKSFMRILHEKYWFKSSVLMGDTGQIIILGGKEPNGEDYFVNDLTYCFIEACEELHLPDPKVFLRVSAKMPRKLMEVALKCIKTGIGGPLLSNDDVIIPILMKAGYGEDSYNYVTSACWEPLILGKSIAQNNIDSLVWIEPLNKMLDTENLAEITSKEQLIEKYKNYLQNYIKEFIDNINKIQWEKAPLLSLFVEGPSQSLKDVADGGAFYHNYGLTTVSLSNTINAIYNIQKFVFEDKKYTLTALNKMRQENFENNPEVVKELKNQPIRFGTDEKQIIALTNQITEYANEVLEEKRNPWGGTIKIGYSAPTYIMKAENCPASLDGRKNNEPFGTHISTDKAGVAYTELIQFASKLKYDGKRFNGNVIDFMITPSFIEEHFDKMVDFLILSITLGFFQMQMNVTSSEILIKAKANPKEYQDLIVRVWGFSAYFNDLPENYKDLLIERALRNEGKSY